MIFVNFFTPFIRVLRVCVPISNVYDFIKLQINAQCVFVFFFPFILDIKFVGRTSRGHTAGRKVAQDFSSTVLLRCVP